MAFNLSEFKSAAFSRGGIANDNRFEVIIEPPAFLKKDRGIHNILRYFCNAVSIPSFALGTTASQRQGYGHTQQNVTGMTFEPITTVFMVDGNHEVIDFFRTWQRGIVQYDNRDPNKETNGSLPFEINYRKDYQAPSIIINVYGRSDNVTSGASPIGPGGTPVPSYQYKLDGAFPSSVGSTSLAWSNNNSILTLPVTFQYKGISHTSMDSAKREYNDPVKSTDLNLSNLFG